MVQISTSSPSSQLALRTVQTHDPYITLADTAATMAELPDNFPPSTSSSSSSSPSLSSSSATAILNKPFPIRRSVSCPHQQRLASKPRLRRFTDESKRPKVVLYTTSLRGVRRTFDDCCAIRAILRGLRVAVDDRDVSMDASYHSELKALLGKGLRFSLPQVFVGNRWLGGAEEIRLMNEAGDLGRMLEGVAAQDPAFVCGGCGGMRFAPCSNCYGSQKVFVEDERRMRPCNVCNENGLDEAIKVGASQALE